MSKVQELFSKFIKIFHFYGFWSKDLPKWHLRVLIVSYLILEGLCFLLIAASFLEVADFDDFVISLMYTSGYFWMISCDLNFLLKQQKIDVFLEKLCEIFYEDEAAVPFVDAACSTAQRMAKRTAIIEILTLNFGIILIPSIFHVFLLPMWKFQGLDGGLAYGLCLVLQILSINFAIVKIISIMFFWYSLMVVINGYARFLGHKFRTLSSEEGLRSLIGCIDAHLKLKSILADLFGIFGFSFGLFFKFVEVIIGTTIFAITKGDSELNFGRNLTFYGYIVVLTFDNLIPSFLGQEINSTTELYSTDLYFSDWIEADSRYKKVFMILMENLKNPVKMSVMWYSNLNLEAFREAMKSGYSSYSVLSKVKHNNVNT